jgi:hypothetical protein
VGISDLGDGLTWGEAKLLLDEAAADPGTALGAEMAGWAYPASLRELLTLAAQVGDWKSARKIMPWVMPDPRGTKQTASAEEIAAAQAVLEEGIVFS